MRRCGFRIFCFILPLSLTLLLATVLVACASNTGGALSAATTSGQGGGGSGGPASGSPAIIASTATPTTSIASPGTGEGGIAEFCSGASDIESPLPASIPGYPNAQMRISKTSGGNGIFGLCTADSSAQVLAYYLAQLPDKGWQQIKNNTILTTEQIQATHGTGYITITIEPDGQLSNTTDIIVQTSGVS